VAPENRDAMEGTGPEPASLVGFDIGNTSVKCAALVAGRWELLCRVGTRPLDTLAERLADSFPEERLSQVTGGRCVACSVQPAADDAVRDLWRAMGGAGEVAFLGAEVPIRMATRVWEPEGVGRDRLVLAMGARELCGAPCVVVSAGTAITVDWVDRDGAFAGGAIAPGFGLSARALHAGTALLPLVEPAVPRHPVGRSTEEALVSGIYWACAGGVLALVENYLREHEAPDAPVLCTGSDAPLLLSALEQTGARHEPLLLFRGMAEALRRSGR